MPLHDCYKQDDRRPLRHDDADKSEYWRTRNEFKAIRSECRSHKIKFTDPDFCPESSLGFSTRRDVKHDKDTTLPVDIVSWQRPESVRLTGREDHEESSEWKLIKDAHPSDIEQGRLGNCWFVAALALIAERTKLLSEIFISRKLNPEGIYALRLFKGGRWQGVIIDDRFPCDAYNRLVFSRCRRKQLWVMLIEKAMAKLHGSYASLESGQISEGLNYLTGFVSERINLEMEQDTDLLWARLLSFYAAEFLMGASFDEREEGMKKYFKDEMGLVPNHVYSILKVVCMENLKLIQLRNPWGRFCWKGDWSDESSLWNEHPEAVCYLSPHRANEGIFWMCFDDFIKIFTALEVCKVRENWRVSTVEGLLAPYADPELPSCFQLFTETPVEVDISLYKSSSTHGRETMQDTEVGFMIFETNANLPSASRFQLVKPFHQSVETSGYRTVSCDLLLNSGHYCVVPFSFGHWSAIESKDVFYNYAFSIHSSRAVQVSSVQRCSILAEALICYADHFGEKKYLLKDSDTLSLTSVKFGNRNYGTVVENRTVDKCVEMRMDTTITGDYISTRNSFSTRDKIQPQNCQVTQVLCVRKGGASSHRTTYSTMITHVKPNQPAKKRHNDADTHDPPLTERSFGLHQPRRCCDS